MHVAVRRDRHRVAVDLAVGGVGIWETAVKVPIAGICEEGRRPKPISSSRYRCGGGGRSLLQQETRRYGSGVYTSKTGETRNSSCAVHGERLRERTRIYRSAAARGNPEVRAGAKMKLLQRRELRIGEAQEDLRRDAAHDAATSVPTRL